MNTAQFSMFRRIAAFTVFGLGLLARVSAESVVINLPFTSGQGCVVSPKGAMVGLEFLKTSAPDLIYLEAEQAAGLAMQEGRGVLRDAAYSGGACVSHVTHAEFPLNMAAPGEYQGWALTYLPSAGSWNHQESMDKGNPQRITDSAQGIFGQWFWSRLGKYNLAKGNHTFILHNWLGGARLDALVFGRNTDLSLEDIWGSPFLEEKGTGVVVTQQVLPSGVLKWERIVADTEMNDGSVGVEVSTDGGTSWEPVSSDGDLSPIRVTGDGRDVLLTRFRLKVSPEGKSPLLRSAKVQLLLAPDAEVTAENARFRVSFSRKTGTLCGVFNKATATVVAPLHVQRPLIGLAVREPGATHQTVISPNDVELEKIDRNGKSLILSYRALDGGIRIALRIDVDSTPLSKWQLSVRNLSKMEVIRIDFPLIANAAIGDPNDDECVLPRTGGWRIGNPAASKAWKTTYLGGGSMSWMDLCDAKSGLYLAMLDKQLTSTEMECAPNEGQRGADLTMRTHTLVRAGESKTRDYAVGVHVGDWHWAADRYREWAYSWMKRPHNPEWLKWCDGWAQAMGNVKFSGMAGLLQRMKADGLNYLQYWGHMADGLDQCCGNFYWPAPSLGGAEGFRKGVEEVHKVGGHVTAYMNCQTWTRDSAINESLRNTAKSDLPQEALNLVRPLDWFEQWRLFPLDGKPMGYYADTLGWYIMCPASRGFQEHLRFWIVDMYCKRFGVDGIYIDQTGATLAKPCYNLNHGHTDIGAWGMGNVELLKICIEEARKINPDFILSIEGAGDALGQYANLHLISGLCTDPEVYHYTFPDHILISGFCNNSPLSREQRVSRAFLNGDRFDAWVNDRLMQSAIRLRQRIKRWLYPGRFMDTVGLSVSDRRVLARWAWCNEPREKAIVFTFDNEHEVSGATCSFSLPKGWTTPRSFFLFDREGVVTPVEFHNRNGQMFFDVPASTLSAGLLLYATGVATLLDVWDETQVGGVGGDRIKLNVLNLGDQALPVKVALSAEPPLALAGNAVALTVPARGTRQTEVHVSGTDQLKGFGNVSFGLTWPGGKKSGQALIHPILLNGGLDIDEDSDGCPDFWYPGGTTSNFPYGIENGAFWVQGQEKEFQYLIQHLPLKPNTKYHFSGRIKRSAPSSKIYMALVEFVGEKGYRIYGIGDDEKLPANEWQRFEKTVTLGDAKSWRSSAAIYLYNTHTNLRAWFDDIELREVE